MVMIFIFDGVTVKTCSLSQLCSEILERGVDSIVTLLALVICCHSRQYKETFSLRGWRDLVRECFCFGSEAVNARGEAVRGLVKSRVEFPPAQISGVF